MVKEGMHGFKVGETQESAPDDTQAIQKIIDDQDPNQMTTLQFPKGFFGISGAIKMHSNLTLNGVASKDSRWTNDSHMVALWPTADNGNQYQYKRATWWYPTQAKGYGGPKNVNDVHWNNITFNGRTDINNSLQELQAITHSTNISFKHCEFDRTETAPGHSLDLGGVNGVTVTDSTFRGYHATSTTRKEAIQVDYTILTSSSTNSDKNLTVVHKEPNTGNDKNQSLGATHILPDPKWHINESLYMDGLPSKNVDITHSRFLPVYSSGNIMDSPTIGIQAPNPTGQHIQYAGQYIGSVNFTGNYNENSITPGKDAMGGKTMLPVTPDGKQILEKYNGIIHFPNANDINISNNIFRQTQSNPDTQGIIDMTMNFNAGRLPTDVMVHDGNDNDGNKTNLKVNTGAPFTQTPIKGAIFNNNDIIGFKSSKNFWAIGQRSTNTDKYDDVIQGIENKNNTYVNGISALPAVLPAPNGNLVTNQLPKNYVEGGNQVKSRADYATPVISVKQDTLTVPAAAPGNAHPDYTQYGATVSDKLDDWQDKNLDPISFDDHQVKFDKVGTYKVTIKTHNSLHVAGTRDVNLNVVASKPEISGEDATVKVGSDFDPVTALKLAAHDAVDGDLSKKLKTTGTVDTSKPGKYTVTATVTNSNKEKTERTFTVTVSDAKLNLTAPALTLKVGDKFPTATDDIKATDASGNPVTDLKISTLDALPDTTKAGDYVIHYLVSAHGLTGTVTRDVHVVAVPQTPQPQPDAVALTGKNVNLDLATTKPSDQEFLKLAGIKLKVDGQDSDAHISVDTSQFKPDVAGKYLVTFTVQVAGETISKPVWVYVGAPQDDAKFTVHDFTIDRGQGLTEDQVRQHFSAQDKTAGDVTKQVKIDLSQVNTNQAGVYPVTLTYTANGQVTKQELKVTVEAGEPTLNVHDISMVQGTDVYRAIAAGKFTAKDPVAGDLTAQIKYDISKVDPATPNTYEVTATVPKTSLKKTFKLTVEKDMPEIQGPADMTLAYGQAPYTEQQALANTVATDSAGNKIDAKVTVTGIKAINTKVPGKYTVTYSVTNKLGNTTTKDITVTVAHAIPQITVNGGNKEGFLVLKPGNAQDILKQIQAHVTARAEDSGLIDSQLLKISAEDANLFNNMNFVKGTTYNFHFTITDKHNMTGETEISFAIGDENGKAPKSGIDSLKPYLRKDTIDYTPVPAAGNSTFEDTNLQRLTSELDTLPHNPLTPFVAQILDPSSIHFDRPGSYKVSVRLFNGLVDRTVPLTVNISVKDAVATTVTHVKEQAQQLAKKGKQAIEHPIKTYGELPQTGQRATLATLALGSLAIVSGLTLLILKKLRGKNDQ